jgi:hypothetical protein
MEGSAMPKAGLPSLVLGLVVMVVAIGCTSVGPVVTPVVPASLSPSQAPSAQPTASTPDVIASVTGLPSPAISIAPASIAPTDSPTTTVQPTRTPKPTTAAAPNLVVTKFEIDADYVLAEKPVDALFTVRNIGTADAGAFQTEVAETHTDDGVKGTSDSFAVQGGLAAGDSVKITISISLPKDGNWKLAATADSEDAVAESDESDNSREVTVKALAGLPDFQWFKDGFSAFDTGEVTAEGHKIELQAKFSNDGTAAYNSSLFDIGMTWYRDEDSASGNLTPFVYADEMEPGATAELSKIDFLPGPGTYTIYAYIDDGRVVDELSEDNNETSAKLTLQ